MDFLFTVVVFLLLCGCLCIFLAVPSVGLWSAFTCIFYMTLTSFLFMI